MRALTFLLLLLLPAWSRAAPPSPFAAIAEAARPGIVTVRGYDKNEVLLRTRPGFFVGDSHVVTVRHPLIGAQRADVVLADGSAVAVTGLDADDPASDLVLLRVSTASDPLQVGTAGKARRALSWAGKPPAAGDLVIVVSDGPDGAAPVSAGTLSAYKTIPGLGAVLAIDAPVSPRREGSPVLTYDGEVVGVTSVGYDGARKKTVAFVTTRVAKLTAGDSASLPTWSNLAQAAIAKSGPDLYGSARASLAAGNLEIALARLEQAIMKAPGHQDAWLSLGVVKARLERWDEAVECFERVTRLFRDHVEAQTNLCVALTHLERWSTARTPCDEAHRLAVTDVRVLLQQALVAEQLDGPEAALAAYDRVLEQDPFQLDALYGRALLLLGRGRYPEATEALQNVCTRDASFRDSLRRLGDAWVGQGKHHEAVDAYRKALEVKGADALVYTRLGQSWLALNHEGKALDAFEHAARLQPSEAKIYYALGQSLGRMKRLDQATTMFRQAVRLNEGFVAAWFELGEILRARNKLDDARDAYQRCLTLDDRHAGAMESLGLVYVAKGERDAAWDQVRRLQPIDATRARELADHIIEPGL